MQPFSTISCNRHVDNMFYLRPSRNTEKKENEETVRRVAPERRSCFAAAMDHCGSPPVLQKDCPLKDAFADRGARGVRAGGPVDTTTRGGRPHAGGRPGLVSTGSTSPHPGGHQPGAGPTIVSGSIVRRGQSYKFIKNLIKI